MLSIDCSLTTIKIVNLLFCSRHRRWLPCEVIIKHRTTWLEWTAHWTKWNPQFYVEQFSAKYGTHLPCGIYVVKERFPIATLKRSARHCSATKTTLCGPYCSHGFYVNKVVLSCLLCFLPLGLHRSVLKSVQSSGITKTPALLTQA